MTTLWGTLNQMATWPIFSAQSAARLSNISNDFEYMYNNQSIYSMRWAAVAAGFSAGVDTINAIMSGTVAITALSRGESLSSLSSSLVTPLKALGGLSFAFNYVADGSNVAALYKEHGNSAEFRIALDNWAMKCFYGALFTTAGMTLGMTGLALISIAALGYAIGGFIYDIDHGNYDTFVHRFPKFIQDGIKGIANTAHLLRDPLVLDLDGDGIELTSLENSTTFFDYDRDGYAERTGWVAPDDGMLAIDRNGNGLVDDISELFGAPSQDGFAVLETLDSNADGVIDAGDADFAKLRVWRDLNQNGLTDAGELQTLAEAGIASLSLTRADVAGTNAGHGRGFAGLFTRTNGSTGTAETIYFQTDAQTAIDPEFTLAEGVSALPQLQASGHIHSLAWKASTDAAFRADWLAMADGAGTLSRDAFVR